MFMTAALGAAIVLAAGTAWRAAWTSDWGLAVATSAVPFVPKALLEVLLAVAIVRHGRRWIGGESS
jgi:biotin transporter BioY